MKVPVSDMEKSDTHTSNLLPQQGQTVSEMELEKLSKTPTNTNGNTYHHNGAKPNDYRKPVSATCFRPAINYGLDVLLLQRKTPLSVVPLNLHSMLNHFLVEIHINKICLLLGELYSIVYIHCHLYQKKVLSINGELDPNILFRCSSNAHSHVCSIS